MTTSKVPRVIYMHLVYIFGIYTVCMYVSMCVCMEDYYLLVHVCIYDYIYEFLSICTCMYEYMCVLQ